MQNVLYLPDPGPLYAVASTLISGTLSGEPVWMLLVGPPSCGKSTLLMSTFKVPGVHTAGAVSVGGLLSGVSAKDRIAGSKGGLLLKVGQYGAIVWEEFSTVATGDKVEKEKLFDLFRQCYQGRYQRDGGADGGKEVVWPRASTNGHAGIESDQGKLTILGGFTTALDYEENAALMSWLGERFVYYRYTDNSDGWAETNRAIDTERTGVREKLADLMEAFWREVGRGWEPRSYAQRLTGKESERLIRWAQFAARGRSPVSRDKYTREIVAVPMAERPQRIGQVLTQLYLAGGLMGLEPDERWKLVGKIAMDSLPLLRKSIVEMLLPGAIGKSAYDIAARTRVSARTAKLGAEDLEVHGVLEKVSGGKGEASVWRLSEWAKERI